MYSLNLSQRKLLVYFLLFFTVTGYAQTVKKIFGTEIDKKEGAVALRYQQMFHTYTNGYYSMVDFALPQGMKRFNSFKFDKTLKYISKAELDNKSFPKLASWDAMLSLKNKVYLPYITGDPKAKYYEYVFAEYNPQDANFVQPYKVAVKKSNIAVSYLGGYFTNVSTDSTKLLVRYTYAPEKRNNNVNFAKWGFTVFDQSINELWNLDYTCNYVESKMNVENWGISKTGDVYLLIKVYKEGRAESTSEGLPNFNYELYKFQKGQSQPKVAIIDPLDKFGYRFIFFESTKDGMYLSSAFNYKPKFDKSDGISFNKIEDPKTGFLKKLTYFEIPDLQIAKYSPQFEAANSTSSPADLKAYNLEISKIIPTSTGGGYYVIAEEVNYDNIKLNLASLSSSDINYEFYNAYIFLIAKDGKLLWMNKLPKKQVGYYGPGIGSYNYFLQKDNLFLLFNDSEKNINLEPNKEPTLIGATEPRILRMVKIDKKGNMSISEIMKSKEEGTPLIRDFIRVNKTTIFGLAISLDNTLIPLTLKLE